MVDLQVLDFEGDAVARVPANETALAVQRDLALFGVKGEIDEVEIVVYLAEPEPEPVPVAFNPGDVYQVTYPSGGVYTYFRTRDGWTGNMTDDSMVKWLGSQRAVKCAVVPETSI